MENWTRVSRLRPWHVAVFCAAIFMAGMMAPTPVSYTHLTLPTSYPV